MKLFVILVAALFCSTGLLLSQSNDAKRAEEIQKRSEEAQKSLRGISSVFVVVQPVNDDVSKQGLSTAHLRSVVEASLTKAGVNMAKEPQQKEGSANLIVTVDTIQQQGACLFTTRVALTQSVQLTRNAKLGTFAGQTWNALALGLTTPGQFEVIDQALQAKLTEFTTAFKAANAR